MDFNSNPQKNTRKKFTWISAPAYIFAFEFAHHPLKQKNSVHKKHTTMENSATSSKLSGSNKKGGAADSLAFKQQAPKQQQQHFNFLTQTNLSMHNMDAAKIMHGAKKLTPLTCSRSSSSSNRYQNAAAAAIDFDYLEEKLKQIQASSDNTKKLLPTQSSSNPALKSSIKPMAAVTTTTPRRSDDKNRSEYESGADYSETNSSHSKKINFKLKEATNGLAAKPKKELHRSVSNMDHQRPVTTSSLKQKLNMSKENTLRHTQPLPHQHHNRAQSQLSYSSNKLSQSAASHYDSQPIYEDDFIDEYTDDDEDPSAGKIKTS